MVICPGPEVMEVPLGFRLVTVDGCTLGQAEEMLRLMTPLVRS